MPNDAYYSSNASVEWYTPEFLTQSVLAVMGEIDCDPCSNPEPFNIPAKIHYTQVDDGLIKPWHGRIYVNPPYGDSLPGFIEKLLTERQLGRCIEAITLTPARTDTKWFQPLWGSDAICFIRKRVTFAFSKSVSTFPVAMTYHGNNVARFAEVFIQHGQIIYPNAVYEKPTVQKTLWDL